MKISGYTCVRNCFDLDYCFQLTIQSLLPVSDEVVVSDGQSTDGTREYLDDWAKKEPKLRIVNYPWPNPHRDIHWWTEWLNRTRIQLRFPMQLQLDADEVLDPRCYEAARAVAEKGECRWFKRLNFWRDAQHLAPSGHVCGDQAVRMGPTELWLPSDEPHPEGEPEIIQRAGWPPNADGSLVIYHYGFLRREQALIDKCRVVNGAFFGTMDERLIKAEAAGTPWVNEIEFSEEHNGERVIRHLRPFTGMHPELAHEWLKERGYTP